MKTDKMAIPFNEKLSCSTCGFIGAFDLTTVAWCPLCWRDAAAIRNELRRGKHPDQMPAINPLEDEQVENLLKLVVYDRVCSRKLIQEHEKLEHQLAVLLEISSSILDSLDRNYSITRSQRYKLRNAIEPLKPACKFHFQASTECGSPVSKHWNPNHGLPYCDRHQPECCKEPLSDNHDTNQKP